MKGKHLVTYLGQGIYKDREGVLWGKEKGNPNIQESREIEFDGDREAFLANKPDLDFMVEYGQMTVATVTVDAEEPAGDAQTPPAGDGGVNIVIG